MKIEVNGLVKTYKDKGDSVRALRGVSFGLPESGLVFVLGKSGCGKSTLLNVLGGLDGFDGGDIKVGGESLKDFSGGRLDDYRNRCVGFVFQENNLLESHTVEYNVGLALDLQHFENRAERIKQALGLVELSELSGRKCNRLSGGQKQRVAIARAIVKEPQILLCDEPTGSLDSETGKDIFNLLKKISETTLVVIVSHDRESAQTYGDRIIEMQDGSIISDSATAESKAERPVTVTERRKKCGLSFSKVMRTGAEYLISRPVRFALSVLICLISLFFVGVTDNFASVNMATSITKAMDECKVSHLVYRSNFTEANKEEYIWGDRMNEDDFGRLQTVTEGQRLDKIYCAYNFDFGMCNLQYIDISKLTYLGERICGFMEIDDGLLNDYGFTLYGKMPENYNEIVIPMYFFNAYKLYGDSNFQGLNEPEDIIGKSMFINFGYEEYSFGSGLFNYKITGVLDTKINEEVYGDYIYRQRTPKYKYESGCSLRHLFMCSMHSCVYVAKGYYQNVFTKNHEFTESEKKIGLIYGVASPYTGNYSQRLDKVKKSMLRFETVVEDSEKKVEQYFPIDNDASGAVMGLFNERVLYYVPLMRYICIGMVVFSVLFFLYYTVSVFAEKKKEFGTLRSIGATGGDLVKILAAENGIYILAITLVSSVMAAIAIALFNAATVAAYFILPVRMMSFSIKQFAVILGVAVLSITAGMAIPLIRLLRAKPVDLISGRK